MKTGRTVRTAVLAGSATALLVLVLAACSNGAEGDRCEFDNGNDDCQDGLVCVPKAASSRPGNGTVNPPYNNSDRCCPLDRATATHPACTQNSTSTITDSAPPTDTGPGTDSSAIDAPTDSPADVVDSGPDVADAATDG